ncbi:MAG: fumarylacetoacetate hydrolase family protein [Firmicutes bacterium]|nr:fumarylacetoacetate hydrolase family protein [Bacillota bacterium]
MKFAMVSVGPEHAPAPAVVSREGHVVLLRDLMVSPPPSIDAVVKDPAWLAAISQAQSQNLSAVTYDPNEVLWHAPVSLRRNVFCVGKNYQEHIAEGQRAGDPVQASTEVPIIFTKATTSLNHHRGFITAWKITQALDYEAELGVVLGTGGRHISFDDVQDYIFGYTLINDVTARDLQNRHRQWFVGKSLDTFCPIGPVVVTRDEVDWPVHIRMTLAVNGEVRQTLDTRDMVFDIPTVVSSLSQAITLLPGDVIATGTGAGCGFAFEPPKFLKPGDEIVIACDAIGDLINFVQEG